MVAIKWKGSKVTLKEKLAASIKAAQDIVNPAVEAKRELTADEMAQVETLDTEIEDLKSQIDRAEKSADLVSRITAAPVDEPEAPVAAQKSKATGGVAERFIKSDAFQSFRKSHPSGVGSGTPLHIEAKNIATVDDLLGKSANGLQKKELTTATGQFVSEQRLPGYRSDLLDEPLEFLNLITTGNTAASYIEYARVVSETDNAAIVPEGELKPLSEVVTDTADAKAYTYADGFDVTNQTLSDDGALVAFMEGRIRFHVLNKVVDTLLNGSGTGTEPAGLMNITGTQAQEFDGENALTTLARAIEKVQNVQAAAQAIVLNPTDAWNIRLLKNGNGDFYAGGPFSAAPFSPWGVRVVESSRVAKGTALVGDFSQIQFLEREALSVVAFNQHKDYAQRNKSYVRAELRGLQLFYAPREIVIADIATPADDSGE